MIHWTTTKHVFADVANTPAKIARVAECTNMEEIYKAMKTARQCADGYVDCISFVSDRSWFNWFRCERARPAHVINKTPDDRPIVNPSIRMEDGMFIVEVNRREH